MPCGCKSLSLFVVGLCSCLVCVPAVSTFSCRQLLLRGAQCISRQPLVLSSLPTSCRQADAGGLLRSCASTVWLRVTHEESALVSE